MISSGAPAPASALHAELQRGQIGGGVVEAAVAFSHQRRMVFQLRHVVKENRHRPFARPGEAALLQFIHHFFQARIVMAFAVTVIELDPQPRIDPLELRLGERDHLPPDAQVLLVAALQFDQFLARGFQDLRIRFAGGVDHFVKPLHLRRSGSARKRCRVQPRLPAHEQFAKLRAPIADVIVRDDPVAQQPQNPRQRVPQDGGTNVPDMHRLGHVGRTEVNYNGARGRRLLKKQMRPRRRLRPRTAPGRPV